MPRLSFLVRFLVTIVAMGNLSSSQKFHPVNPINPQDVSSQDVNFSSNSLSGSTNIHYEEGYFVDTVFDGNKLNISVYRTVASEDYMYAVDSSANRLLKIRLPINLDDKELCRTVVGDWSGTRGYRDGVCEQALLNNPKGLTVDDSGNIYVADVGNRAIRKISPSGYVTTIAGQSNKTGCADGEGKNALFSADFDLSYLPGTCSLVVLDRGNRRIRMIQLKSFLECSLENEAPSGNNNIWRRLLDSGVGIISGITGTIFWILLFHKWEVQRNFQPAIRAILGVNQIGNADDKTHGGNSGENADNMTQGGSLRGNADLCVDLLGGYDDSRSANDSEHFGQNSLQPSGIPEAGMWSDSDDRSLSFIEFSVTPAKTQNSQEGSGIGKKDGLKNAIDHGKKVSSRGQSSGKGLGIVIEESQDDVAYRKKFLSAVSQNSSQDQEHFGQNNHRGPDEGRSVMGRVQISSAEVHALDYSDNDSEDLIRLKRKKEDGCVIGENGAMACTGIYMQTNAKRFQSDDETLSESWTGTPHSCRTDYVPDLSLPCSADHEPGPSDVHPVSISLLMDKNFEEFQKLGCNARDEE